MADRETHPRMRQLVDWRAAVWAGLVSGIVVFLLDLFLAPLIMGGNAWIMTRFIASIAMGEGILAPPATFNATAFVAAILVNFVISMGYALLIAYIVHRGGLLTGILGGAGLGLAIYGINFYTFTYFYPWLFPLCGWAMGVIHMIFGTLAGGVYEFLEVEEFVPVEEES